MVLNRILRALQHSTHYNIYLVNYIEQDLGIHNKVVYHWGVLPSHPWREVPRREFAFRVVEREGERDTEMERRCLRDAFCARGLCRLTRRGELLKNRRVLVVNGAQGEHRQKIVEGLKREGVSKVLWCPISLRRSLYDSVDMEPFIDNVDLALVGAGIGKANIMLQMETLNVPCIDAGYVFQVWTDPKNKWKRVVCAPDDDWEEATNDNRT